MTDPIHLPRILITNDDGIDAPGLKVLAKIAEQFTDEVWIIAPDEDQSGVSQKLTICSPVQIKKRKERKWAIKGTPSDCVVIALSHLMADARPSLVLSGVNATSNLGDEVNLSGTIGAAMTALMLGIPSIAISQAGKTRDTVPWATTQAILPVVLHHLLSEGWRKETCLSVNIPDLPPEEITGLSWSRQSHKNIGNVSAYRRISPRREEYFWLAIEEKDPVLSQTSDHAILSRGEVSVTALSADRSIETTKPFRSFRKADPLKQLTEIDDEDE